MVKIYQGMGVFTRAVYNTPQSFCGTLQCSKAGNQGTFISRRLSKMPYCDNRRSRISEAYITAIFGVSDSRKFQPKKWWCLEVMKALLICHLKFMNEFGSGVQHQS
jgi:hypothetical protein